jgi:hypothetical protein
MSGAPPSRLLRKINKKVEKPATPNLPSFNRANFDIRLAKGVLKPGLFAQRRMTDNPVLVARTSLE